MTTEVSHRCATSPPTQMSLDSPLPRPGLGQATQLDVALKKDSIGEMIKQEITQLRQHIGTIRELFRKVVGPLEEFDDEYLGSDPSRQLAPEWESLQKVYPASYLCCMSLTLTCLLVSFSSLTPASTTAGIVPRRRPL